MFLELLGHCHCVNLIYVCYVDCCRSDMLVSFFSLQNISLCYIGFANAKRLACFEVHAGNLKSLLHLFGFLYCKKNERVEACEQ
jgi:hypothetical protein